jgi:selenocysteine-specific elongation factor
MIIGTAGHIDHGKSALVTALTGRPMDRLSEERRREITIELNFAPLDLGDGRTAGVVDVPGHEDFIRTMVAGASGLDLVLLVIAADEGIMPQTEEHLIILEQLRVAVGIPVITRIW